MGYHSAIVRMTKQIYPRALIFQNPDQNIIIIGVPENSRRAFILSFEDWIKQNLQISLRVICADEIDNAWTELKDTGDL